MARLFKVTLECWPPSDTRPAYCVEVFEQIRTASPNRVLHFSIGNPPLEEDLDWLYDVLGAETIQLVDRTIGVQQRLKLQS
jgi:hypothetical protein